MISVFNRKLIIKKIMYLTGNVNFFFLMICDRVFPIQIFTHLAMGTKIRLEKTTYSCSKLSTATKGKIRTFSRGLLNATTLNLLVGVCY